MVKQITSGGRGIRVLNFEQLTEKADISYKPIEKNIEKAGMYTVTEIEKLENEMKEYIFSDDPKEQDKYIKIWKILKDRQRYDFRVENELQRQAYNRRQYGFNEEEKKEPAPPTPPKKKPAPAPAPAPEPAPEPAPVSKKKAKLSQEEVRQILIKNRKPQRVQIEEEPMFFKMNKPSLVPTPKRAFQPINIRRDGSVSNDQYASLFSNIQSKQEI